MTGYGSASVQVGSAVVTVEARAVNQRFLDVRVRVPNALSDCAAAMDSVARKQLVRGRVEIAARLEDALAGQVTLNRERAKHALRDLEALRSELGLSEPVPLSLLAALPGLFVEQLGFDPDALRESVQRATEAACHALTAMRRTEGLSLAADLRQHLARIEALGRELSQRQDGLTEGYRDKLRARISALLQGSSVTLDQGRLEQEVAIVAERADVSEEITRLLSHCGQFAGLLDADSEEPSGRRLEFLLQEMGREVNTLGSKVSDLQCLGWILEQKAELERMREQVQNVL
jgi:uncharacterized protein (TIGR00255 family)